MVYYDAAVIGGGVLGCFAARNLRRWNISTVLLEAAEDVCTGITRANSAVVYAGYDNKVGSLKAKMAVSGNAFFSRLCEELEVPFEQKGSLMAAFGPNGDQALRKKLEQGSANGVPGLQLLPGADAREMEPFLSKVVTSALYAPSTGTVSPWQLGIAAYENALHNGCEGMLNTKVLAIRREAGRYVLETNREMLSCRVILNCAGLQADKVQELLFPPSIRIYMNASDYLVLDKRAPSPKHILFQEREEKGRGIAAVPTVEGNLLLEGALRPLTDKPWATTREGLGNLQQEVSRFLPEVDLTQVIRSFASVRPNPHRVVFRNGQWVPDGKSIGSFAVENPAPGFYSLIGIKTPGLTCANELGMYLAEKTALYLDASQNDSFDPHRAAIPRKKDDPDFYQIVCQCEGITKGEILEAIRRGASTVDGVKRRVGAGMGRCQGNRCACEIAKLLKQTGTNPRTLF